MALVMDDIKYFIVVSETCNITRASEKIGISQPALSYSIKRLEKEVGGELLIRLKNGMRLTKLGESFLTRARKLIVEWENVQNIAADSSLIDSSYTFAIHPSIALYSMRAFLPTIIRNFPTLDINFIHGLSREMTEKIISWEADFGIVVNPIRHNDLVIKKLCTDSVSIFHLDGIESNTLIFDEDLLQAQHIIKNYKSIHHYENNIRSKNLEVVAKLTSLGLGHGVLPTRVAEQFPRLKQVKGAPIFKDEICLIYRPERQKDHIGQKIIDIIKKARF
ncbi:LysR family transcriptional regulator [Bacteriovorax sp. BSW11_IV]|uniref:LysR family transcriptional regulator n=1 Tax=Bacteriovorax sp. BSW11_IV TaxID=1353529 RepID=UPI000558456B|nr:LysR family transcriptional regulator [Bacteriovorax sp. BSW11_IV]